MRMFCVMCRKSLLFDEKLVCVSVVLCLESKDEEKQWLRVKVISVI